MRKPQKPDGGPAFPVIFDHEECVSEAPGMSLRDRIAIQAMAIYIQQFPAQTIPLPETIARFSFAVADAMIAERSKE